MATNIKLKSSSLTGKTPTLSDLSLRELAVNTADGKLFLRKGDGSGTDKIIDVTAPLQASEPMGHENKSQSVISFNTVNRRFTIQPVSTSFNVWCKGVKYNFTTAQTVDLPNTTGIYYIYFDGDGALQYRTSYFDWENDAPTAYVYWNATTGTAPFVADERHGIVLDWQTHEYLHRTRGAVIANGFSISNYITTGDGSLDSDSQFDLGGGTFFDEDLEVIITHSNTPTADTWEQDLEGPSQIPVFYQSGNGWVRDTPTDYALKQGTARIKYNLFSGGSWTTPDVPTDTHYTTSWIIATNNINYPVISIMGQSESNKITDEEELTFGDLILAGFPVVEFRPLYKIIWQTDSEYANTPNARIAGVYDIRQLSSGGGISGTTPVSDHGLLTGLGDDDHLQYVHVSENRSITASHTISGTLTISNASNSALTVAGNVGIGTTNSTEKLHIYSSDAVSSINIDSSNSGTTTYYSLAGVRKYTTEYVPSSNFFSIGRSEVAYDLNLKDGNIGIGTTNPTQKLQIQNGGILVNGAATPNLNLTPTDGSNGNADISFNGTSFILVSNSISADLRLGTYSTPRLTITSTGNVGLGVTNPSDKLVVAGNIWMDSDSYKIYNGPSNNSAGILFPNSTTRIDGYSGITFHSSATTVGGQTERVRITSTGDVGIGVTNPGSKLAVNGYITESTDGGTTYWNVVTQQDVGTAPNQLPLNQYLGQLAFLDDFSPNGLRREGGSVDDVVVTSSGDVGIGTTNPVQLLDLYGSDKLIKINSFTDSSSIAIGQWDGFHNRVESVNRPLYFTTYTGSIEFGPSNSKALSITSSGNVGIGTGNPLQKLHVQGSAYIAGSGNRPVTIDSNVTIRMEAGGWSSQYGFLDTTGTSLGGFGAFGATNTLSYYWIGSAYDSPSLIVGSSGNVGIGTISPISKLDVRGWTFINSDSVDPNWNSQLRIDGNATYDPKIVLASNNGYRWSIRNDDPAGNGELKFRYEEGDADFVTFTRTGLVGIGITNPEQKLHVSGAVHINGGATGGGVNITDGTWLRLGTLNSTGSPFIGYGVRAKTGVEGANANELVSTTSIGLGRSAIIVGSLNGGVSGTFQVWTGPAESGVADGGTLTNFQQRLTVDATGNVGIGTTNPYGKLSIATNNEQIEFTPGSSSGTLNGGVIEYINRTTSSIRPDLNIYLSAGGGSFKVYTSAEERLRVNSTGNVGIGTTNPTDKLHIYSSTVVYNSIESSAATNAGVRIKNTLSDWYIINDSNGELQFYKGDIRLLIDSTGNVGIGTNDPQYKLEVNGSFAATTKSFIIPHPTKEGYKLRHGSLEGPENGVYVRGRSTDSIIHLPEYWVKLIDPDSITVNLTPIVRPGAIWVERIEDNQVIIGREDEAMEYFYMVLAERCDVEKLEVEVSP